MPKWGAFGSVRGFEMASVIITSGEQKGDYCPLGQRTTVVGRAETLPIQILDDMISRKHLQIRYVKEEGKYYAVDMKSRHGVFVNGGKISSETALVDGDEILIGETTLLFTDKDFDDRESALSHFKKVGERSRPTHMQ